MKNILMPFVMVIFWVGAGIATVLAGTVSVIASLFPNPRKLQHLCLRFWGKMVCYCGFTRVKVEGKENILKGEPQIFAANHQAIHDIFVLGGWIAEPFTWIVRKEWFNWPFLGWHLHRSGNISIDRSNPRASAKSVIEAADRIRSGTSTVVFPEGTRNPDARLQKFKGGGFVLAMKSGVPIIPISIVGAKDIVRKNTYWVRPGTIKVVIGKPIITKDYGKKERGKLMADTKAAIAAHLPDEYLVDYHEELKAAEAGEGEESSVE